ncbi:putative cyclin-B3-1 isoform X2 [Silene latifolia]|uniref:putative cyclin-B3-1 isoform X2 n=1 Tax=Silene latifolia TaxID=37657 RepID=UPI003D77711C
MLPLKKTVPGPTHTVALSKFKVYSENSKVNGRALPNVDTNTSRTLLKKGSSLSNNTALKERSLVIGAEKTRVSQDLLGKTKLGRRALADVSNIRQTSSRLQKPSCSRNSTSFTTRTSTASSSRPPIVKVNALATGATVSHCNVKPSTKTMRNSSNFRRVEANETPNRTRNSFPEMKNTRLSHDLKSQGDVKTADNSTRKIGFPVMKTRIGAVSHLKTKVTKDKASDGFTQITQRNQTRTDALHGFRKSVQPIPRTTLQISNAQRNSKYESIYSVGKSRGVTSGRRVKVATSSVPETVKSIIAQALVTQGANPVEGSDDLKPHSLDSTSIKKSTRRKSYSSELISRSKYIEAVKEEILPNIDDGGNPLEVAEYVDDIYQYYWIVETQSKSLENYMIQADITPQMRSILINWLVEVHYKFDLMAETLYLAVALLDRYLSVVSITKRELQLVGLTSLLLASKYEDFWHPGVKDLISISAESYTRKQFLEMEKDILKKLKFRMNLPTPYVFMLRFLKASQSEKKLEHLAFYLIELCLIDYEVLKFRPSLLCASAVYVARCTLNKSPAWTPLLEKHAHYSKIQIRECAQKILSIHKDASSCLLKVTYDKYKRPEFNGVTSIKPLVCLP